MAKEVVSATRVTCDGTRQRSCGKVLVSDADGLVVHGKITTVGNRTLLEVGTGETALCWACFHLICPADPLMHGVQVQASYQEYEGNYDRTPGKGPTGPMAPPDLPRCVEVVSALCTVR